MNPLPRRTAVVSGGSSGIGRSLVAHLHRDGWTVHACGRDAARLAALSGEFPGVVTHPCDVADRGQVESFARAVAAASAAVELLVSNAGGLREIDFTGPDLRDVDLTSELRINTEGAIHLIAAFLPALRASAAHPAILIVSSGYALAPATRAPVYSASKAALHSLAKSLRRQLAPLRIAVTELLPPLVDTPAVAHRKGKKLSADAVAQLALDGVRDGAEEVHPGDVRLLPAMLRLVPGFIERVVART